MAVFRNIMAFLGGLAIVLGAIFGFGMLDKDFRTFVCSVLGAVPQQEYQVVIEEKDNLMLELENTTVEIDSLTADRDNMIVERDNLVVEVDNLNREIDNLNKDRMYLEDRIRMLEDDLIMSDDRIEQYRQEIDMLNDEIFMLNDEIMRFHDDIRFYDDEIMRLNDEISSLLNEIDNLNLEIDRLNNELMTISTTLDNATLSYLGEFSRIELNYYNEEDNAWWGNGSSGTEGFEQHHLGSDVSMFFERYENDVAFIQEKMLENPTNTAYVITVNYYQLRIDDQLMLFDLLETSLTYQITTDTTFEIKYVFEGVESNRDKITSQVATDRSYALLAEYSYSLNQDNTVANVICEINVNLEV